MRCEPLISTVAGMRCAACALMTFFERRKVDFQRTLDRRRTYIDVVERVLRSALPTDLHRPGLFRRFDFVTLGSTVSAVEVHLFHDLDGKRSRTGSNRPPPVICAPAGARS